MSRRSATIEPGYFEDLYRRDADPWRFATSDYERGKYDETLAVLPQPKFGAALEVGCSIGVLTARLAPRCGHLLAIDVSPAALAQARERCAGLAVSFAQRAVPAEWPPGRFDLILLSEVLYYLDGADLRRTAGLTARALPIGGCAVLVHYLGETDYPLSGDAAADAFIAESGLRVGHAVRRDQYRIDVLEAAADASIVNSIGN